MALMLDQSLTPALMRQPLCAADAGMQLEQIYGPWQNAYAAFTPANMAAASKLALKALLLHVGCVTSVVRQAQLSWYREWLFGVVIIHHGICNHYIRNVKVACPAWYGYNRYRACSAGRPIPGCN